MSWRIGHPELSRMIYVAAESMLFFYARSPLLRSLFSLVFGYTRLQGRKLLNLNKTGLARYAESGGGSVGLLLTLAGAASLAV